MKRLLVLLAISASAFAAETPSDITRATVIERMNAYRGEAGLPPLREDERLTRAAEDRMRDMEDLGYWSHESPSGISPFSWVIGRGYSYSSAAENLAAGFETVSLLVQSWMESRGHRDSIMSPDFQDCGVAILDGATTGPATGKSIVVLFGAPRAPLLTPPASTDPPRAPSVPSHQ